MSKSKKVTIRIEEQDGILQRREYPVDPTSVFVDGVLLSEYVEAYQRAQRRTGILD